MKKLYVLIMLTLLFKASIAQNTFPTSGNVGVGTTSPTSALHIIGKTKMQNNLKLFSNGDDAFGEGVVICRANRLVWITICKNRSCSWAI
ncbi:hypothetical protein [Pedobacter metabolipauper]|uniref:Uncharacterized protein n=1 Tax=Pedobacter metabolipauper TaxID=425513 RepID=A0A4R6SZN9_9SPHI|nr:hypothetical protein [Pedobacter metabolipauper]TDQ11557.1 hypothetical protein ATK78_0680 [Pedobacter metabolipauper]